MTIKSTRVTSYDANVFGWFSLQHSKRGYKNGVALSRHVESAHAGQFIDTCRACQEIKAKMEASK